MESEFCRETLSGYGGLVSSSEQAGLGPSAGSPASAEGIGEVKKVASRPWSEAACGPGDLGEAGGKGKPEGVGMDAVNHLSPACRSCSPAPDLPVYWGD